MEIINVVPIDAEGWVYEVTLEDSCKNKFIGLVKYQEKKTGENK